MTDSVSDKWCGLFCEFSQVTTALGAGVIVVACAVWASAVASAAVGTNLVGVPQTKPMQ